MQKSGALLGGGVLHHGVKGVSSPPAGGGFVGERDNDWASTTGSGNLAGETTWIYPSPPAKGTFAGGGAL